jgi:hypothetical protein
MEIIDLLIAANNGGGNGIAPRIPEKFTWIHTDTNKNTWEISDPGSTELDTREKIHFDGPMIGGGRISEHPSIIDDLKMSLILAVELASQVGGRAVNSISSCRSYVGDLKRISNELIALGFVSWKDWDPANNGSLLERLALRESDSHNYLRQIEEYVDEVGLEDLPWAKSNKNSLRIVSANVYAELGLNAYAARKNSEVVRFWQQCHLDYKKLYPEKWIEFRESLYLGLPDKTNRVHEKQYRDYLGAIESIYYHSTLVPGLFIDPWNVITIENHAEAIDKAFPESLERLSGKTRNIPVPVYLEIMDAAARYVLDYSSALLEIGETAGEVYGLLRESVGGYQAGKEINRSIKDWKVLVGGKHSPFPLAAYKHHQKGVTEIDSEWWPVFEEMIAVGMSSKEIQAELGLTKAQFDGRKRLLAEREKRKVHSGVSLQKALYQYLPVSCLLIILAISARRELEVYNLRPSGYDLTPDGWMINFYCAKTKRKSRWFTTVPLVIRCVQILETLSESARMRTGNNNLFFFDDTFNRDEVSIRRFAEVMDDFQKFIGVPADEDGNYHAFSEHQFRRFFAILFFYRYPRERGQDLEALMHELGHDDWTMSSEYITEVRQGAIFKQIESERVADYALRAIDKDGVSGAMASELTALIQASIRVVPEQRREAAMTSLEGKSLSIEFISEGVCFGVTPGREIDGNCYEEGNLMIHRCSNAMCEGCPNLLSVDEIRNDYSRNIDFNGSCGESEILDTVIAKSS